MARMRITLVAAAATIAALAAPTTASAVTVTDCEDLQTALDNEAVVVLSGTTCTGHFDLDPGRATQFSGENGAKLTGVGESQILSGSDVEGSTIKNLIFVDGRAAGSGGAIRLDGNSGVTIEHNEFTDNRAVEGDGGAIAIELDNQRLARSVTEPLPVILRDNTFGGSDAGNRAAERGGAVFVSAFERDVVIDSTFSDDTHRSTFTENDARDGGGLYVDAAATLRLDGNEFSENSADSTGGGAHITNACRADIVDNVFDFNTVRQDDSGIAGGGLYMDSGQACGFNPKGVARGEDQSQVTQAGNLFDSNRLSGDNFTSGIGGGEAIFGLSVISTDDRFVENVIEVGDGADGGGLAYFGFGSTFAARNLVATGNEASSQQVPDSAQARGTVVRPSRGGGLYLTGRVDEFRIEDSTIVENSADQGSGIDGPSQQQFEQPVLSRGADALFNVLVLHNSIVFGNTGASAGEIAGFTQRDVRFSDTCVAGSATAAAGQGNLCVNPQLAGGEEPGTVDQAGDRPTVDKGDSSLVDGDLAEDYAGDARVINGKVDIGADEYKPPTVTPTPTTTTTTPAAAKPAPQGAVLGVQQRSCRSKRAFRIRIRVPRGEKALSATVRVNNKKVKVVRGKRLRAPVRLRGLPKGRFSVRITVRLANGKKLTGKRTYHTCIPKLPGDGPPKL